MKLIKIKLNNSWNEFHYPIMYHLLIKSWPIFCLNFVCSKVWDALTGDELHSFEHKHIVRACTFSEVDLALFLSLLFISLLL